MLKNLGEQIKHIRKLHNFTQIQFAKMLNISQGNLSEIESGKLNPSLETIIILCKNYYLDFNGFINDQVNEVSSFILDNDESKLIYGFRQLQTETKEELINFLEMKLKRYSKNG
ncbi:helix-turn-helix domain-containing protein [Paenibacillus sp. SI8]|uniref:helix-turn-helix domain-containing protein n=1 Tax=unclassified Paenibacillus TaxID=185978 RepID=UPI003466F16F